MEFTPDNPRLRPGAHRRDAAQSTSGARISGLLIGAMALLEALGFFFPGILTRIAAEAWVFTGAGYLALAGLAVGRTMLRDLRERVFLGWLLLVLAALPTFWGSGGVDRLEINSEASMQVSLGLANLSEPDLAQDGKGFLSYPRRQYTIAALPAWLAGRNLWALRFGFAFPFFTGLLVFYAGLRAASRRPDTFAAALGLTFIFCFTRVVPWLRAYEQTILPLAFTLHATGWWLLGRARRLSVPSVALGLAWLGGVLVMGYTPGMSSAALLVVLLAGGTFFHFWRAAIPRNRFLSSQIILYLAVLGGIALWLQWGPQLGFGSPARRPPNNEFSQRSVDFLTGVFLSRPDGGLVFPIMVLPLVVLLGAALGGWLGARARVIAAWSGLTIVAAVFLRGFVQRSAAFDLHRAMVIIPPLCTLAALWLDRRRFFRPLTDAGRLAGARQGALVVAVLLVAGHGTWTYGASIRPTPPGPRPLDVVLLDAVDFTRARGLPPDAAIEVRSAAEFTPLNVPDYLGYFLRGARFQRGEYPVRASHWHPTLVLQYRALKAEEEPPPAELDPGNASRVLRTRDGTVVRIADTAPPEAPFP